MLFIHKLHQLMTLINRCLVFVGAVVDKDVIGLVVPHGATGQVENIGGIVATGAVFGQLCRVTNYNHIHIAANGKPAAVG